MTPERWQQVKAAVQAALESPPAARAALLDRACGPDAELRREVESLLHASDTADGFLARPAIVDAGFAFADAGRDPELITRLAATLHAHYVVERELGGGGMSRVFVATERALHRRVVVKLLPPELAAGLSVDRFRREIALLAGLQHANIVPLLSAGEMDGLPYYTMPYVEGLTLRERLQREGALALPEAAGVLHDVARALAHAHERGVVHRDIKPDNVLLAGGAAMVTDFGIAKALSAARTTTTGDAAAGGGDGTLTQLGIALGTPAYMAPEQVAGGADVDHRADVYALGCTAYELLTGRPPFHGRPTHRLAFAHLTESPAPVTSARPQVPPAMAAMIMRCLAKDPAARPSSVEVARALDGWASLEARPSIPGRRRARLALVAALVAFAAAPFVASVVARARQRPAGSGAPRTVAVLPIDQLGGDTTNAYFAAGLADELTNALAQIDGLRVTPPSALGGAGGRGRDVDEIARRLGVSALLEGSVQRAADRLRIRVRLLNAADGHVLWSNAYDRRLADILAVQTDIADSVAASLRLRLSDATQARVAGASGTRDANAYLLYLQGRYAASRYTEPDLRRAVALYRQAVGHDSAFARAWAGMADAWTSLAGDFVPPAEALPPARDAARRALALDTALAEAHIALGNVLLSEWNTAAAAIAFGRAVALDPNSAATHYYLASALLPLGRSDEALTHAAAAERLEPGNPAYATAVALVLLRAGRLDSAAARARRAYALDSTFMYALTVLGDALRLNGDPRAALDAYAGRGPAQTAYELVQPALAHIALGQPEEARRTIRELAALGSRQNVPADAVAMVYAHLGQRDSAFAWLERAYVARSAGLLSLGVDADWGPLRGDPRFAKLARRVSRR